MSQRLRKSITRKKGKQHSQNKFLGRTGIHLVHVCRWVFVNSHFWMQLPLPLHWVSYNYYLGYLPMKSNDCMLLSMINLINPISKKKSKLLFFALSHHFRKKVMFSVYRPNHRFQYQC